MKFPNLYLGTVRVLSKIANLASKYDCSDPCSFRDMMFFVIFFQKISENLNYDYFKKNLQFPTLYLGTVRVLSRIANLASKYDCSNAYSFRDMKFFVIFSKIFRKKNYDYFKKKFAIPNPVLGYCQSTVKDCESCLQT